LDSSAKVFPLVSDFQTNPTIAYHAYIVDFFCNRTAPAGMGGDDVEPAGKTP
jgi:hypothetical protein